MKKFFIAVALGTGLFAAQAVNAQSAQSTEKKYVVTNPATAATSPARSERTVKVHHPRAHKQVRTVERSTTVTPTSREQKNMVSKKGHSASSSTSSGPTKSGMRTDNKKASRSEKRSVPPSGSKR